MSFLPIWVLLPVWPKPGNPDLCRGTAGWLQQSGYHAFQPWVLGSQGYCTVLQMQIELPLHTTVASGESGILTMGPRGSAQEPEETETTGPECDPLALQGCVSIQFASQLNVRHIPFKEDSILFYSL